MARSRADHRASCRPDRLSRLVLRPRAGTQTRALESDRPRRRNRVRQRRRAVSATYARECILVNHLAATEANVIAQHVIEHASPRGAGGILPVGRSPRGLSVRVVREDGSEAQADEVGALVVSSAHVSPGYWRRPELNTAAFSTEPGEPGATRYLTGDLGRVDHEGNLHFLGRKGSRVKIRGQSIDLSEVEAALAACPGVVRSAVLASSEDPQAEPDKLVAYLVVDQDTQRNALVIRRHAAKRLPSYMLPSAFVFLDALPLTATGKIARNALA
ncbi:MAG: amino acid adenylation domain-containing protein, partial [Betaproteobacteria bacterium]